ncbi:hypothetical protein DY000_02037729 [Brassica cretica]|uniref:DUF4005 domain-containing protein n=1 Tax=Brassica cretica TaxID=69181 RepID=A0ABQ7BQH8_BRACR|nr:hypothetical protein DY000_02037729 [Brassica cretica]
MPVKNHKALDRRDQSSKRLISHTYSKGKHTRRRTLSKPGVTNMAKEKSHRDASSDESCNEMKEHKWKSRQNEIIKSWSRPRAIEARSPKTIS